MRFRVFIDGRPPVAAHGTDVDGQGNGTATEQTVYQLIRNQRLSLIDSSRSSFLTLVWRCLISPSAEPSQMLLCGCHAVSVASSGSKGWREINVRRR
ncbi:MAG: hypothetical protein JOY71_02550 [Acetobacteraceae bacterium]|nr:hypothetical protein [Acetobacteraceae bacterium]MBV8521005.1 hypothetical protein [Acetobacteraceae bacterium]